MIETSFKNYGEAYQYMAAQNKAHQDKIFSIPHDRSNVVIERTMQEYNPPAIQKQRGTDHKVHWADIPEYISPVTGKPVDGRAARREDLKRSGSRECDPSEFKPTYTNERFARKYGLPLAEQ